MTEPRKLYRDPEKAMVGGVAAGVAEYLRSDPTVVRVVLVIIAVVTAVIPTVLIYLLMWALVPPRPPSATPGVNASLQQS
jgi:phage shock protein C